MARPVPALPPGEQSKVFAHLFQSKVFARLFQKAAGSKGGALGRHPQMAERPMLQAHLGGSGGILQEKIPPGPPFFAPSLRLWPPHGGGGPEGRRGDDRFLGLPPPPLSRCGGSSPHGRAGAGAGRRFVLRRGWRERYGLCPHGRPQALRGGEAGTVRRAFLRKSFRKWKAPPRCAHPDAPRRGNFLKKRPDIKKNPTRGFFFMP